MGHLDDIFSTTLEALASQPSTWLLDAEDVVVDFSLIVDFDPRRTVAGAYPEFAGDVLLHDGEPWEWYFYEALAESGWDRQRVFASYQEHHGPAVSWVYRLYMEHLAEGFVTKSVRVAWAAQMIQACKDRGQRVWALGNASSYWLDAAREIYPAFALCDGVFASYECGLRKPDIMIYRTFMKRLLPADARAICFLEKDAWYAHHLQEMMTLGSLAEGSCLHCLHVQ